MTYIELTDKLNSMKQSADLETDDYCLNKTKIINDTIDNVISYIHELALQNIVIYVK